MDLPEKIKKIFIDEPVHQLATASKSGVPNVCSVGAKYLLDDATIIVVDNYFRKTLNNILENPFAAVLIRIQKESYQIKGSCSYLTSGPVYEQARKWMKEKGDKYPAKGAVQIKVEEIYNSSAGSGSGDRIYGAE